MAVKGLTLQLICPKLVKIFNKMAAFQRENQAVSACFGALKFDFLTKMWYNIIGGGAYC